MRIVSQSENLQAVENTANLLNDPPPSGYTYGFPVLGAGLTSLSGYDRTAIVIFRGFLQKLVEEWLRCGKKVMPEDAEVDGYGTGPVEGYSTSVDWSLSLIPKAGQLTDGSVIQAKELDRSDPAHNTWLWRVYWDYLERAKPNIWFNSDGEVLFTYMTPVYSQPEPFIALPPFLNADSPDLNCWMEAVLWFILLLNSGYAQRLDRCTFCKRYFVRKRERKRGQVYKRGGPSCGICRSESSKACTSDARADAKDRMLRVAAEAWTDWKKSNRTPDRYAAVAERVNTKCKKDIYITTRRRRIEPLWVKRNEKAILARAERNAENKGEN